MNKYSVLLFIVIIFLVNVVECGIFGRSQSPSLYGVAPNRMGNNAAINSQYGNYDYNNNNANLNSNAFVNRQYQYFNQIDQHPNAVTNKNLSRSYSSGLSAWGLIIIIMLIIVIVMGAYYGLLCYPLICREERNYDIMDAASVTASANTPTRSSDFEKSGNYSSRSTTPSVIINT